MKLTAVFETWHIGDGNYPPFHKGMNVNLSFELMPESLRKVDRGRKQVWNQFEDAEYEFCGDVLKVYSNENRIVVLEMEGFRCYVNSFPKDNLELNEGDRVEGRGQLLLDHYIWVEYLHTYPDPPDLFYSLKVERIRAVAIPEQLIRRSEKGMSYPCSLSPPQYRTAKVREVEEMEDNGCKFYLVDFDSAGGSEAVRRTFC